MRDVIPSSHLHLTITREGAGFRWQIHADRCAKPLQRSPREYATYSDAVNWGEHALAILARSDNAAG